MFMKVLPVILWVLAWQVTLPFNGVQAQTPATAITGASPAAARPVATPPAAPPAFDDYRMDIQAGVRIDSYNLAPLAEHDDARTQSMIDGIAGRGATHHPLTADNDAGNRAAKDWYLLPRPVIVLLWLAAVMALIVMVVRRLRQEP